MTGTPPQTPAPGSNPPPAGRPARPADLLGKPDKPKRIVYAVEVLPAVEAKDGAPAKTEREALVPLAVVHADTNDEACWLWSESPDGRDGAMSDNPPKLTSIGTGRGGLPEPKTYPLEPAVRRVR